MKRIAIGLGALFVLIAGFTVVFSILDPLLPGSAPGTVKAGYERWHDMGQRIESSGMVLSILAFPTGPRSRCASSEAVALLRPFSRFSA